jgi:hypothetical protein
MQTRPLLLAMQVMLCACCPLLGMLFFAAALQRLT